MLKVALAKKLLNVKPLSEVVLVTVSELIRRLMLSMLLPKKSVWLGLPVKKVSDIPKPPQAVYSYQLREGGGKSESVASKALQIALSPSGKSTALYFLSQGDRFWGQTHPLYN
jgi:hypothetical protein